MSTLPLKKNVASKNSEKLAEFLKFDMSERLGECIHYYIIGRTVDNGNIVMILLLTFLHSFSSYTLCMLLPHAYYLFLFPSTDFLFFHAQPYCLCIASCTVLHSLLTNV